MASSLQLCQAGTGRGLRCTLPGLGVSQRANHASSDLPVFRQQRPSASRLTVCANYGGRGFRGSFRPGRDADWASFFQGLSEMSKAFESAAQDYESQYAKTGQRYQEAAPSSDAEDVSVAVGVPVDIEEREDGYSLWMDVPGLQKSDLKIQVFPQQRRITISGERKRQTGEAADGPEASRTLRTRYERGVGKFSRTLKLSKDLDVATLNARVEKGVLHITAKKIPAVEPSSDVVEVAID